MLRAPLLPCPAFCLLSLACKPVTPRAHAFAEALVSRSGWLPPALFGGFLSQWGRLSQAAHCPLLVAVPCGLGVRGAVDLQPGCATWHYGQPRVCEVEIFG